MPCLFLSISQITTILSRNSLTDSIFFVTVDDGTALLDIIVFGDLYRQHEELFNKHKIIILKCTLSHDKQYNLRVRALEVSNINDLRIECCDEIELSIKESSFDKTKLLALKKLILLQKEGFSKVLLSYKNIENANTVGKVILNDNRGIKPTNQFILELSQLFGDGSIKLNYNRKNHSLMRGILK